MFSPNFRDGVENMGAQIFQNSGDISEFEASEC